MRNIGLHQLSLGLPHLEMLVLDHNLDDCTFVPDFDRRRLLDVVAAFPSLRTEQKVQPASSIHVADRPVAADTARAMFAYLRERHERVRRLILHSGALHENLLNGKSFTNFNHLECRLAYEPGAGGSGSAKGAGDGDQDDMGGYYVSVSSPDLGSAGNFELDRLARLTPKERPTGPVEELDEQEMLIKAALEGPQVRRDWDSVQQQKATQAKFAAKYHQAEEERKRSRLSNLVSNLRESRDKMWKGFLSQIGHTERDPSGS